MKKVVVEVAFKLNYKFAYYQKILSKCGAINTFNCETHDLYYTNQDLNNLSEGQMKQSCVRYRMVKGLSGRDFDGNHNWRCNFQNYQVFDSTHSNSFSCSLSQLKTYEKILNQASYQKVFDTTKIDHQYKIGDMKSCIQLQDIENIGLVLYYDNPLYYDLPYSIQRRKLIDELHSYGFTEFTEDTPNFDKLRTLYYQKECFSLNTDN